MFEKFTKNARFAVIAAQEEARNTKAERIDIQHILLGVLSTASPEFDAVLASTGLTHKAARDALAREDQLGRDDAEALRSIGIDLDAVRDSVESSFGENAWSQTKRKPGLFGNRSRHIPFSKDAKKTLELALREAMHRKDRHIGSEHVLLGILRSPDDSTRRVIEVHLSLADLRVRVEASMARAA